MKTFKLLLVAFIGIVVFISCKKTMLQLVMEAPDSPTTIPTDTMMTQVPLVAISDTIPGKYIYLTIDDSPLNGSQYIDSIIRTTGIKTNIFLVGHPIDESSRFKKNYELLNGNPYIEIYNHSYTHANHKYLRYYKNPEQVLDDFEKNRIDFHLPHRIARLPGRNLWHVAGKTKNYKQTGAEAAQLLAEKGYRIFGWDVEWKYDSKDNTPLQTIDELVEEIENLYNTSSTFTVDHVILLMHDQMFGKINSKNDLETLIYKLLENGYTFKYLHDYPIQKKQS